VDSAPYPPLGRVTDLLPAMVRVWESATILARLELSLGYLAGEANNPADGNVFNGPYSALAQVVIAKSALSTLA